MKQDWRLSNQMEYLFNKKLIETKFINTNNHWDHEHCEFCLETIDETTENAYSTTDGYYWICPKCFDDFKDMFKWKISR